MITASVKKELRRKNNAITDKIIRDIRSLFESNEENYDEPVRTGNTFDNDHFEYERGSDKNKTLSIEEHLNKIRPYLKNIINDLRALG